MAVQELQYADEQVFISPLDGPLASAEYTNPLLLFLFRIYLGFIFLQGLATRTFMESSDQCMIM